MQDRLFRVLALLGRIVLFAVLVAFLSGLAAPLLQLVRSAVPELPFGSLAVGLGAPLLASLVVTFLVMRLIERKRLVDAGLWLNGAGGRNLLIGLATGALGACLVTVLPLAAGWAHLRATPSPGFGGALFLILLLFIGSSGEEVATRGYPFQLLVRAVGALPALVASGSFFAAGHVWNPGASKYGIANTFLAGAVLGYAFLRSRDLWLPIGVHTGWNVMLPAFGARLSGFELNLGPHEMAWSVSATWSGGDYGPEAGALTTFAFLVWAVLLWKAPVAVQDAPLLRPPAAPVSPGGYETSNSIV